MRRLVVLATLVFIGSPIALAAEGVSKRWNLVGTVIDRGAGIAGLCSGAFGLDIKGPQDQDDCDGFFDVLFYADLRSRQVFWSRGSSERVNTPNLRRTSIVSLRSQLQSGGETVLENIRTSYLESDQFKGVPELSKKDPADPQSQVEYEPVKTDQANHELNNNNRKPVVKPKSEDPTLGNCRVGDKVDFSGGWAVGAAGVFPFSDPASVMDRVQESSEKDRERMAKDSPMVFRWHQNGVGCEGVGRLEAMPVFLSRPLGGGAIRGGRFFIVTANVSADDGRKGACYLLVDARNLRCAW